MAIKSRLLILFLVIMGKALGKTEQNTLGRGKERGVKAG